VKYIALNGFRHPLNRYFTDAVQCVNRFNWTQAAAIRLAEQIDADGQETTVIGFSDGATAAVTVARHSKVTAHVYAHSPMYEASDLPLAARRLTLFRTKGDTTPTFDDTLEVFWAFCRSTERTRLHIHTLLPLPAQPVRDAATWLMRRKSHQFHNCLPFLPASIVRTPSPGDRHGAKSD
jgi:hypothetical protein